MIARAFGRERRARGANSAHIAARGEREVLDDYAEGSAALSRIAGFSDAVFAIAITLLVLDLKAPEVLHGQPRELVRSVAGLWPKFFSFLLSFAVIYIFWVGHHRMFQHIRRSDAGLLWLNSLLLLCVVFLPFPAALFGEHENHPFAVTLYALSMGLTSLVSTLLWRYVTRDRRLVAVDLDQHVVTHYLVRALVPMAMFFVSAAVAQVSVWAGVAMWPLILPVQALVLRRYPLPEAAHR